MKKRTHSNHSLQRAEKAPSQGAPVEAKQEKKIEAHKHHNHCPLPRPQKKEPSKHKKTHDEGQAIKQLKAPILNELRHLASNLISSSDRLAHGLKDEPKGPLQIYKHDRHKLIEYLNSLIVRPIAIDSLSKGKPHPEDKKGESFNEPTRQSPNTSLDAYLTRQVGEIKEKIEKAINRKRSKSSTSQFHAHLEGQVTLVKTKLEELQKRTNQIREEQLTSFVKLCKKLNEMNKLENPPNNPQSSEFLGGEVESLKVQLKEQSNKNTRLQKEIAQLSSKIHTLQNNVVYIQLLLIKSKRIIHHDIITSPQDQHHYKIEKEKISLLSKTVQEVDDYIHKQKKHPESALQKMRGETQDMIMQLNDLCKKSFQIIEEKNKTLDSLRSQRQEKERNEVYCEEMKAEIWNLNASLSDLLKEIEINEEEIESLKLENASLREDLRNMEELVRQTKEEYGDRIHEITEKIRSNQAQLSAKEEQISILMSELQARNGQLISKMQEIQSKEEDIQSLKKEHSKSQESLSQTITTLNEEKKLLMLEKQRKENELREAQNKLKFMEEESVILEKKIEHVFNGEEQYKFRIQTLEEQVKTLQLQNEQLYKDLRSFENDQESNEENNQQLMKANKILLQQIATLKEDINESNKKIRFYEEKIVELAKLADTSFYDQVIETQERRINELTRKLKQSSSEIIEESSEEADYTESANETNEEIHPVPSEVVINIHPELPKKQLEPQPSEAIDYYPFLLQDHTPESRSRKNSGQVEFLTLSRNEEGGLSAVSALSHYDIIVLNEQQDTIDVHKAIYPKSSRKQPSDTHAIPARSNYADASSSQHSDRAGTLHSHSNKHHPLNPDYIHDTPVEQAVKEDNENLSEASRRVNLDFQVRGEKMGDFGEDIPKAHANPSQIKDLIMSQPNTEKEEGQQSRLFKNVNVQQQRRAQLRFSGQRQTVSRIAEKQKAASPKKQGTVYIRIRRQNSSLNPITPKHRSRSCYNEPV